MKEFEPLVFLAVFQEMLGPLLWIMLLLAVGGVAAFVLLFVREKGIDSRRLVRAELIGLVGGVAALVLMAKVTVSGFSDAGGPIDWLLVGLVWGTGLAGTTILAYDAMGWRRLLGRN